MTASALAAPPAPPPFACGASERRLDQAIDRLWERLMGHSSAVCPVCGGEMRPEYGTGARPVGGRCVACCSRLT